MAVDALMFGAVDKVAEFTKLSTGFLPPQLSNAAQFGFNTTVYDAEALGLALAGGNGTSNAFATNFGSLSVSAFAQAVAAATGVSTNAIQQFVTRSTFILQTLPPPTACPLPWRPTARPLAMRLVLRLLIRPRQTSSRWSRMP
jgi:hypothetical protein